jgi:hypothetical protein
VKLVEAKREQRRVEQREESQALGEFHSGIRACERGHQRRAQNGGGSLHEL